MKSLLLGAALALMVSLEAAGQTLIGHNERQGSTLLSHPNSVSSSVELLQHEQELRGYYQSSTNDEDSAPAFRKDSLVVKPLWIRHIPCYRQAPSLAAGVAVEKRRRGQLSLIDGYHPDLSVVVCEGGNFLIAVNTSTGGVVWQYRGPHHRQDHFEGRESGTSSKKDAQQRSGRKKLFDEMAQVKTEYPATTRAVDHPPQDSCRWINHRKLNKYVIVCWSLMVPTYEGYLFALDALTGVPLWISEPYHEPSYWQSLEVVSPSPKSTPVGSPATTGRSGSFPRHSSGTQVVSLAFFRSGSLIAIDVSTGKQVCKITGRRSTIFDPPLTPIGNTGGRVALVHLSNSTNSITSGNSDEKFVTATARGVIMDLSTCQRISN